MNRMCKVFFQNLFGTKKNPFIRTGIICLILFGSLSIADVQVPMKPFILYLMVSTFTAGVMWQGLSSETCAAHMQHMLMLPFAGREFVFSYIAAVGLYTFLTKTAVLLALVLAVSVWSWAELLGSVLCAVNAILMTAAIFSWKQKWPGGVFWSAAVLAVLFSCWEKPWFLPLLLCNSILAVLSLRSADGYAFYLQSEKSRMAAKGRKRYWLWMYFLRYLGSHKNYLANTVILWCMACVFPFFIRQTADWSMIPLGFALLSLNTPVCILLSCDRALERAVRFLPNQKKGFCVPYCAFIFLCNLSADGIFLCSLQIQLGGVTAQMIAVAIFFALQSAIFSVLLEWFCPIRDWKLESDLWHHPRKYLVPATMLLLAVAVGTMPMFQFLLLCLLAAELAGLLLYCGRC